MRDEVEKLGHGKGALFAETPTFAAKMASLSSNFGCSVFQPWLKLMFMIA
jgi:hypothetical protein